MMAMVKVVKEYYKEEEDVRNLIGYIVENNECGRKYNNCFGVRKGDSEITEESEYLEYLFNKFIVSLPQIWKIR